MTDLRTLPKMRWGDVLPLLDHYHVRVEDRGDHWMLVHEESGAMEGLPHYKRDEWVQPINLALIRLMLINFGIAEPEELDEPLRVA